MKNKELSFELLKPLVQLGINEFVICAGARNSPLVLLLDEWSQYNSIIKVFSFFEERSAAFWALGRSRKTGRPVPVITTSGTAAIELLPALVEAYYQGTSMIVITADRPKSYRGSGSPQTIDQVGVFTNYTSSTVDLDEASLSDWTALSEAELRTQLSQKSIHLNVCFDEPLITEAQVDYDSVSQGSKAALPVIPLKKSSKCSSFKSEKPLLVIVSSLKVENQQPVLDFLMQIKALVYCEATSGLRGHPNLASLEIKAGENSLNEFARQAKEFNVIRIGGVPTVRFWRDLETKYKDQEVINFVEAQFSGLARSSQTEPVSSLQIFKASTDFAVYNSVKEVDQKRYTQLQMLLEEFPLSEPAWVHWYSKQVASDPVYLGNSLPIRHWDFVACRGASSSRIFANRGANGIDGQVSTFLGWCSGFSKTDAPASWSLLGDLTALYDLTGPWAQRYSTNLGLRLGVINNQGGQIFDRLFSSRLFINAHQLNFSHWASMWNWDYKVLNQISDQQWQCDSQNPTIIELQPDRQQTLAFEKKWADLWK